MGARSSREGIQKSSSSSAPAPRLLSEKEVDEALCHLQGWSRQGNKLHRQYHFSSFEKALGFRSGLVLVAQTTGHALEESEVYDSVSVDLTTPEVGGIADVDVALATQADALADSLHLPSHLDSMAARRKGHEKTDHERTP